MSWICSMHRKIRNVYTILVGKTDGKDFVDRMEGNIKVDVKEIDCECVNWSHLTQDTHTHTHTSGGSLRAA